MNSTLGVGTVRSQRGYRNRFARLLDHETSATNWRALGEKLGEVAHRLALRYLDGGAGGGAAGDRPSDLPAEIPEPGRVGAVLANQEHIVGTEGLAGVPGGPGAGRTTTTRGTPNRSRMPTSYSWA